MILAWYLVCITPRPYLPSGNTTKVVGIYGTAQRLCRYAAMRLTAVPLRTYDYGMARRKRRSYRNLHDYLDRTGHTQRWLGRQVGIKDSHISDVLRGSRMCSLDVALDLSRLTGIPVEKLLPWDNFRFPRRSTVSVPQEVQKCA